MKGILVILDGLGDLPNKLLNDRTPLEAAHMPNLDFLTARGKMGYMYPVRPDFIPEADESLVSIFGNNLISSTRGQLEASGTDLKLTRGDLATRANFAAIDSLKSGNILDRRVGRTLTTRESEALAKAINTKVRLSTKFTFLPTIQHRGILVLRGGLSDSITNNDSAYNQGVFQEISKIRLCKPTDEDENSQYTANIVNEFLEKAHEVLNEHPINKERTSKGLLPANYILLRGAGVEPPQLKKYPKWFSVSYMPLEMGFSNLSGMEVHSFGYPELEDIDSYANLYEGLKRACDFSIKMIQKHHKRLDYAYVHINETDIPGHDNKPIEKKLMLEYIDSTLFDFLRKFAPSNNIKIIVTSNNSTPCKLKNHTADPVPVLLYDDSMPEERHFSEKEARNGILGKIIGKDLLNKLGFNK